MEAWSEQELDIVEALTRRVRVLCLDQIRRGWWPQHRTGQAPHRKLLRLVSGGLLTRTMINAHPLQELSSPLVTWQPGEDAPDCEGVVERIRRRWHRTPEPLEVFTASPVSANLFGSESRAIPRLTHRDHDLLLAEVYVHYRCHRPAEAKLWVGEDVLPKAGYRIKDPDAFLVADDGSCLRVIESAGRYNLAQIESFHDHCLTYDLPYELW